MPKVHFDMRGALKGLVQGATTPNGARRVQIRRCGATDAVTPPKTNGVASASPYTREGLSADRTSYRSNFLIRSYEVLPDRRASVVTIANLLQETGANHCVDLWGMTDGGFAVHPSMAERNLIFVLTRLQLQMLQYPSWGDVVSIETWFRPQGRASAFREYLMHDAQTGVLLGKATSRWVCFHAQTQRIERFPEALLQESSHLFPVDRPVPIPETETRLKIDEVDLERVTYGPMRFAGHMNTDMNNHINNVVYLTWALDLLPDEVFESYRLRQIEMEFTAECSAGDLIGGCLMEVEHPTGDYQKQFVHELFMNGNGTSATKKQLIRLRTSWSP